MNIQQCWPTWTEHRELSVEHLLTMLQMRQQRFRGFASVEEGRGFMRPKASVNTSAGQEMLRLLMFRVIEECAESYMADDMDHVKEEAIDAINYLWAIPILDEDRWPLPELAKMMHLTFAMPTVATRLTWPPVTPRLTLDDLANVSLWLAGDVGDLLRNRAWMQNAQDVYFAGQTRLDLSIARVTYTLFRLFSGWDEFERFYHAKDVVLSFRLRSRY